MVFRSKIFGVTYDILRGVNATVWGGVEGAEKVGKIVKTGISGADVVIGTSHALEDFGCNDVVCGSLDVIESVSSAVGLEFTLILQYGMGRNDLSICIKGSNIEMSSERMLKCS